MSIFLGAVRGITRWHMGSEVLDALQQRRWDGFILQRLPDEKGRVQFRASYGGRQVFTLVPSHSLNAGARWPEVGHLLLDASLRAPLLDEVRSSMVRNLGYRWDEEVKSPRTSTTSPPARRGL